MYRAEQYSKEKDGSLLSAKVVVPLLLRDFPCSSVIDVGCGIGTWLKVFDESGVHDYVGYDGDHVTREMLLIPWDRFRSADLRFALSIERRYDVACSLEVAEHLPSDAALTLVETLTKAAPVVLFSAAVPGQPGPGHINMQWQDYWADRFAEHGYKPIDLLRPQIWGDDRVCWWYQQNAIVYCAADRSPERDRTPRSLNTVHPSLYSLYSRPIGGKRAVRELSQSVRRRVSALWSGRLSRSQTQIEHGN
jgi:hypothetical protein